MTATVDPTAPLPVDPTDQLPPPPAPHGAPHTFTGAPIGAPSAPHAAPLARTSAPWWRTWRAGARHLARQATAPAHPDEWKLDELRPNYATQAARFDALEAQVRAYGAARRRTVARAGAACAGALVVVYLVAHWRAGWLGGMTVLALTGAATGALPWLAGAHLRRAGALCAICARAPGKCACPPPSAPAAHPGAQGGAPPHLSRELVEEALRDRHVGALGQDQTVTLADVRSTGNGWRCTVTLPRHAGLARHVLAKRHEFAAALGDDTPEDLVHILPVPRSGRSFNLWVAERDPLAGPTPTSHLTSGADVDITRPVVLARSVTTSRPVPHTLIPGVHPLFGGDTGSGKTEAAALWALAYACSSIGRTTVLDPMRSQKWKPFGKVGTLIAGRDAASMRAMAAELVRLAGPELERRARAIDAWCERNPMGAADDQITPEMAAAPWLNAWYELVVIEECHSLYACPHPMYPESSTDKRTVGAVASWAAQELITQGRRLGMSVAEVTQKASGQNIPTEIRDIHTHRACGSSPTGATAKQVLGDGYASTGMAPGSLRPRVHAGTFYITGAALPDDWDAWDLVRFDRSDVNQTRHAIEVAYARLLEQRPEILPDHTPTTPDVATAPAPAGPLETVAEVVARLGDRAHAPAIVAGLAAVDPDRYGPVPATREGLDQLLEGTGITCRRVQVNGTRDYGLRSDMLPGACQEPASDPGTANPPATVLAGPWPPENPA